jgi:hypothetical protein
MSFFDKLGLEKKFYSIFFISIHVFYIDNTITLLNVFVNSKFQKFFSRARCPSLWQPFVCRQQRWSRRAQVWVPSSQSHLRQTGNNNITTMINKRLTFRIQHFSMKLYSIALLFYSLLYVCFFLFVLFLSVSPMTRIDKLDLLSIRSFRRNKNPCTVMFKYLVGVVQCLARWINILFLSERCRLSRVLNQVLCHRHFDARGPVRRRPLEAQPAGGRRSVSLWHVALRAHARESERQNSRRKVLLLRRCKTDHRAQVTIFK